MKRAAKRPSARAATSAASALRLSACSRTASASREIRSGASGSAAMVFLVASRLRISPFVSNALSSISAAAASACPVPSCANAPPSSASSCAESTPARSTSCATPRARRSTSGSASARKHSRCLRIAVSSRSRSRSWLWICGASATKPADGSSASSSSSSRRSCAPWRSSSTSNCGDTPASSGKRRSSPSQKAWIVWIFSPPGVSSARANSVRATESCWSEITASPSSSLPSAARSSSSGSIAQPPSRSNRRFCISAAAAVV